MIVRQNQVRLEVDQGRGQGLLGLHPQADDGDPRLPQHSLVQFRIRQAVLHLQESQWLTHDAGSTPGGTRLISIQYSPKSATVRANSSKATGLATKLLTPNW